MFVILAPAPAILVGVTSPVKLIVPVPLIVFEFKSKFPPKDGEESSETFDIPGAIEVQLVPS